MTQDPKITPARPKPSPKPVRAEGQQPAAAPAEGEEEIVEEGGGMPEWLTVAFPWIASFMLHMGVAIVVLFAAWVFVKKTSDDDANKEQIIIPTAVQDPSTPGGVPHPGEGGNPNRDAAQDLVKTLKSTGWASKQNNNDVSSMLDGSKGESDASLIAAGSGGATGGASGNGSGTSGGGLAPFGTPGGGSGSGPKGGMYGNGGNATKIVFIIDHSGSMIDKMDFVKEEVKKSVNKLIPVQFFAVVTFSEKAEVQGPASLLRATPDSKKLVCDKVDTVRAEGANDDVLEPFADAFRQAFAMKPQMIIFLTDGAFDPKLVDVIKGLNPRKQVAIYTIAYNTGEGGEDAKYSQQLKQLANDNGGQYKFVSE